MGGSLRAALALCGRSMSLTAALWWCSTRLMRCCRVGARDPWKLAPLVGVTAVGFVAVSFFRRRFNAPRPYECCAIAPLIARDGAGKSFPSRHTISAFAIAASWFVASVPVAVVLLVAVCSRFAAFSAVCTFRVTLLPVPSSALLRVRLLLFLRRCSKV